MKQDFEAKEINGAIIPKHFIEILCPNCGRDVDSFELADQKCSDCGFDLSDPKQNVGIHATSAPPAGGKTLGG